MLCYMHVFSLTVRPSKAEKIQKKIQEKQNEATAEEP